MTKENKKDNKKIARSTDNIPNIIIIIIIINDDNSNNDKSCASVLVAITNILPSSASRRVIDYIHTDIKLQPLFLTANRSFIIYHL